MTKHKNNTHIDTTGDISLMDGGGGGVINYTNYCVMMVGDTQLTYCITIGASDDDPLFVIFV